MDAVLFAKTAKGYDEVETKAGNLPTMMRRVLIFVNGARTMEELRTLPKVDNLEGILSQLEYDGYIARTTSAIAANAAALFAPVMAAAAAVFAPQTPTSPPSPVVMGDFRPLPETDNPLQIQQVRNFMNNTLTAFVGSMAVTALVGRLNQAQTHTELRALFAEWYNSLQTTRDGRREADKLKTELLKVI